MAEFSLKPIIMLFVVVIIGAIFLGEIADNQVENTELSGITNESIVMTATTNTIVNETITITSGVGQTGNVSLRSVIFFGNGTNSTHLASVNLATHVNFSKSGEIVVSQHAFDSDSEYNISYTYTADVTGDTAQDDVVSISFFGNGTNSTHSSDITAGIHVNFTKPGVITVDSFPFDPGTYNISYGYEGDLYVVDTKAHPLLRLITIFFVLVIFAFAIQTIKGSSDDFNFGFGKK